MVDRDTRIRTIAKIERELLAEQRAHIGRLENLKDIYGLDLDILTDICGAEAVMDGSGYVGQTVRKRLEAVFEALSEPKSLMYAFAAKEELVPGCRGFGGDPGKRIVLRGALFTDAHSVSIEQRRADNERGPAIILTGRGVLIDEDMAKPIIREDTGEYTGPLVDAETISLPILSREPLTPGSSLLTVRDAWDLLYNTDDAMEIVYALEGFAGAEVSKASRWLLQFATEYSRRVDRGILIN